LFGYYSKSLLPLCEKVIESGDYRMTEVIFGATSRFVDPGELGTLWDDNIIMNVNCPEDYEKLRKIMHRT
jgi:molybdopterin-guanine dinucleotide biosynthesis protein A